MEDREEVMTDKRRAQIRAKFRFKCLVRKVIANLYWIGAETHLKTTKIVLSHRRVGRHVLTPVERSLFRTDAVYRTEQDIDLLYNAAGFLKCFRNYTDYIQRALVAKLYYEYFPPNRVIVRQNAPAWSMYFVIAGHLEIVETKYIEQLGEEVVLSRHHYVEGDNFGDSSLLNDTPRPGTVNTITNCELLVLYKDDFDYILKTLTLERWGQILEAVDSLPFFTNSSEDMRNELCKRSRLAEYARGEVILGDAMGKKAYVHFVIKGTGTLIEHLPMTQEFRYGEPKRALFTLEEETKMLRRWIPRQSTRRSMYTDNNRMSQMKSSQSLTAVSNKSKGSNLLNAASRKSINLQSRRKQQMRSSLIETDAMQTANIDIIYPEGVDIRFVEVCTFSARSVFGLGENFRRRRIVASTPVTCLLIPAYWLLPQSNSWNLIRNHLDKIIPTSKEVFKMYKRDRQFRQFRENYVDYLIGNAPACIGYQNIPYSIRIQEDFAFDSFQG